MVENRVEKPYDARYPRGTDAEALLKRVAREEEELLDSIDPEVIEVFLEDSGNSSRPDTYALDFE